MTLVVDSSAVVETLLQRSGMRTARRVLGFTQERVLAPWLVWSEVTSALRMMVWKGELDEQAGSGYLVDLFASRIEARARDELLPAAWEIARRMGWARTYDAEYCALAELEKASLVTADLRLVRGAEGRLPYVVAIDDV